MRSVLEARVLQLWMRQTLREMHKSPYLREGEWERMLAAYEACFPGQRGPARVEDGQCDLAPAVAHGRVGRG